jgi:anti-sigma B factor antagonist
MFAPRRLCVYSPHILVQTSPPPAPPLSTFNCEFPTAVSPNSFVSPTYIKYARNSFVSPAYANTRGWPPEISSCAPHPRSANPITIIDSVTYLNNIGAPTFSASRFTGRRSLATLFSRVTRHESRITCIVGAPTFCSRNIENRRAQYGNDCTTRQGATLEIEVTTQDGVKVLKLKGRMSIGPTLDRFDKTVAELLKQGQNKIVLDVEEVPQIDSSGIGMLVRHLATAKKEGGAIRLLKPSTFTMHTLKIVGLLNLFSTFEDLPRAIASFQ